MTEQQRTELATRIAERLFADGSGGLATRLELRQEIILGGERSLGGWCFAAAVDQIVKTLGEAPKPEDKR